MKYRLNETSRTDLQTTFRFEVGIEADAANAALGLTENVTGYIQQSDLPSAPGEPITWHLPGGMKNYQAGKRTVSPISMIFVVPTTAGNGSIYKLLEKWAYATYDLDKGTNVGKRNYCTDGIYIYLKGEDDQYKYTFRLLRAQVTNCNYGTVSSEANDLIKVQCTFIYDNYEVYEGYKGPALKTMG
jgi:hypothetical protein